MSTPQRIMNEIHKLTLIVESGESTEQDQRRLARLVEEHPEALPEVANLLDQQAALKDAGLYRAKQTPHTALAKSSRVNPHCIKSRSRLSESQLWQLAPAIAMSLIFTHLAVAGLVWIATSSSDLTAQKLQDSELATSAPYVDVPIAARLSGAPRLVAMSGCVWEEGASVNAKVGQRIEAGNVLRLQEGILTLDLGRAETEGQARLRIEGPAQLFVRPEGTLELVSGSLTADIHWRSGVFQVVTAQGSVSLSGQSLIGLLANSGRSEVHVFDGQAEIGSMWMGSDTVIATLAEGEAATLWGDGAGQPSVVRSKASRSKFVSSRSMAYDQVNLGPIYRETVLQESPDIYWRFEQGDDTVENEGRLDGYTGYVGGSVSWFPGSGHRALELGLTETPGYIASLDTWPARPLDEYTMELWVKPNHFHKAALLSVINPNSPGGGHSTAALLQLSGPFEVNGAAENRFRFAHRPEEPHSSCYSVSSYGVRKWQHLVARKTGSSFELICDGEILSSGESDLPLCTGSRIFVGQLNPINAPHSRDYRAFVGQIDEIALYSHALSDEAIRRHYETATRPVGSESDSI